MIENINSKSIMIRITQTLCIDESEIQLDFIRSSGPGGQNVNKVATAVQLRFNVRQSASLPTEIQRRLMRLAGKRMTADGILIIKARRFRSQEKNRKDAIERLIALVRKATIAPKPRRKTRPSAKAVERRLAAKKKRSQIKRQRGGVEFTEDS